MTNQSREAFETWAVKRYYNLYRCGEGYISHATQQNWNTWQAALSEGRRQACRPLLEALQVIAEALKEPDGGSYWPAREYLDTYDKYHEDLDGTRVLLQVAELAICKAGNAL